MTQPTTNAAQVTAVLLAAGGGRRLGGRPKALLPHRGRPLVENAVRVLREGGCRTVYVVLGAAADEVRARADLTGCVLVDNPGWAEGMGSSLRAGLDALAGADEAAHCAGGPGGGADGGPRAALVSLVDQPGIGAEAVARVLAAHRSGDSLVAASYAGRRGHPVLFGAGRWAEIAASATGDRGARAYLKAHESEITLVECGDVAEPYDIDTEADLGRLQ
ncbi:NTP transferase domain-containing protein [Streptomyces sp. NBC_00083]|uniref:nucleotidyltransferase family protein n=1 Tax=Streptomyces sp. NBC_00083 TaxID=2975647 RepID=UPI002250ABEE|nr:nucleotidyltransferase family protein [Streptomyces sp. NBC_00083]MCX5386444.1 nucleotidyltransferase family protein [Streptomyces sp. NBC_00083]